MGGFEGQVMVGRFGLARLCTAGRIGRPWLGYEANRGASCRLPLYCTPGTDHSWHLDAGQFHTMHPPKDRVAR